MKEQYRIPDSARKATAVTFFPGSSEFIRQAAHVPICNAKLYEEQPGRLTPAALGPLDGRLGVSSKGLVINCLQCICRNCSRLLLTAEEKTNFLRQIANPGLDYLRRKALHKKIITSCKKNKMCLHCGQINGVVKKAVGVPLKIADALDREDISEYTQVMNASQEINKLLPKAKFSQLTPLQVQKIFSRILPEDIAIIMVRCGQEKHPQDLLLTRIPVPPVCIRPSVASEVKAGTTEDDLTMKLSEIFLINDVLRKHKRDGAPSKTVHETWEHLQIQCALYINAEVSGLPPDMQSKKTIRGLTQRLKGKQGRFRGNLSGKRVDFTSRTVISPDPNLRIDQVGVPIHVAKILTFPEVVNDLNIEKMRQLVRNGPDVHPGANYIDSKTQGKRYLRIGNRDYMAEKLQRGDIVERHLNDNDPVLFNRQPSLHKISIMSHRAKVMPGRTLRFNECACAPYNADFDGDEMNLHLPQTYEARAEASLLMGVKSNLITPRSGEPLVAAIQDFITGGYLMTHKDTFFPRAEVHRFAAAIIDASAKKQTRMFIPPPAILRPVELWTGKQLIELVIRPDADSEINLNLKTKNKSYTKNEDLCHNDSYVIIRNSQLICGVLDKSLLGSGSKVNIFYILLRDFGEDAAVDAMWRLARMAPVYLTNRGFSIGIGDVKPSERLLSERKALINEGYHKCDDFIAQLASGRLKTQPGCSEKETLESLILRELSVVRDHAGQVCVKNLSSHNAPLTMAICGSKGSFINISQMIACVGQQAISGHRPPDGFENRCLPHFPRYQNTPQAKGFVENSFYSGLTPTEFFFTRWVDERDLSIQRLDPALMEAKDGSVIDFEHVWNHVRCLTNSNTCDEEIAPAEMKIFIKNSLQDHFSNEIKAYLVEKHREEKSQIDKKEQTMAPNLSDDHVFEEVSNWGTRSSTLAVKTIWNDLWQFLAKIMNRGAKVYELPSTCKSHKNAKTGSRQSNSTSCHNCVRAFNYRKRLLASMYLTHEQVTVFVEKCANKWKKAISEPGTTVGAIAATSIGEPSTQMTLKTFHFAGVASMNITQGVPRIKEIINAVKSISTPVISASLRDESDGDLARRCKARIEKTTLGEICEYIEEVIQADDAFILIKLSAQRIRLLRLEVTPYSIQRAIAATKFEIPLKIADIHPRGKTMIVIRPAVSQKMSRRGHFQYLKRVLSRVIVKGLRDVSRCVIHVDESKGNRHELLIEGTDYLGVMCTNGVNPVKTRFNNALVVAQVLGIEAARKIIIEEILSTMESHGISLDRRHVMLLADIMTYRGEVLGITRNGLVKMKESVLLLASFERTTDHLFEAAFFGQKDEIKGVSESIILGTPIRIGTGMHKLLFKHPASLPIRPRPILLDAIFKDSK
ncbi:unnamed protein product, partial [Mesorhabditis belari]|uniref:DNA-directed RNA polymerase subunit n=1 Tax=Mesorhabditis belari TaxID=2138241 RepID=A0AAF3FPN4_9BILA